jgi:hypothetical protein
VGQCRQCHPKPRDRDDLLAPRGVDAAVVDNERRRDITLAAILVVVDLDDWYLHTVGHRDELAFAIEARSSLMIPISPPAMSMSR